MQNPRLSTEMRKRLHCPVCKAGLSLTAEAAWCVGSQCGRRFPVVDGVPILINESNSVFSLDDFERRRNTTFKLDRGRWESMLDGVLDRLPDISASIGSKKNYANLRDLLLTQADRPKVLVIGGSIEGRGMQTLSGDRNLELVATDVSFGPLTGVVCDAHDIPFDDATFDGVVAQAVLEHVVDPHRCVAEIHRVLRQGGLVYAETPFMQQVHMGRFDFTRFTHSGHRRLFRHFEEIAGGAICGPGMALAWSYQYFLLSFARSRAMRGLIRAFASLTSFYLKYADFYLINKPAAIDAASGFFFMGRKADTVLSDRALIKYYKGSLSN
jgi:SAM-dependent methyltransferase